jgi:hypothetical protein
MAFSSYSPCAGYSVYTDVATHKNFTYIKGKTIPLQALRVPGG